MKITIPGPYKLNKKPVKMKIDKLLLLIVVFFIATISAYAQPKPYKPHQVIDMGSGQKVEILSCYGEGPLEECDCIYYTDRRQNGKRMKQNANRIREEEKAAQIVRDAAIKLRRQQIADSMALARSSGAKPPEKKEKPVDENSPEEKEKRIQERIKNLGEQAKSAASPSLADIARISDSTAKARQQSDVAKKKDVPQKNDAAQKNEVVQKTTEPEKQPEDKPSKVVAKIEEVKTPEPVVQPKAEPVVAHTEPENKTAVSAFSSKNENEAVVDTVIEQTSYVKQYGGVTSNYAAPVPSKETQVAQPVVTKSPETPPVQKQPEQASNATSTPVKEEKPVEQKSETNNAQNKAPEKAPEPIVNNANISKNETVTSSKQPNDTIYLDQAVDKKEVTKNESTSNSSVEKQPARIDNAATPVTENKVEATSKTVEAPPVVKNPEAAKRPAANAALSNDFLKTAEVNVKGTWTKAIIIDREGESLYKVRYEGKGEEADEWVTLSQIRNLDSIKNVPSVSSVISDQKGAAKDCSFNAPAPPVANAAQFSDNIGKRRIYENFYHSKKKEGKGRIGISFLYFQTGSPFANEVIFTDSQEMKTKNAFAPTGAMLYPVKTKIRICDQTGEAITVNVVDRKYSCYRNKDGVWTCTPDKQ